jgi:hypothetical protein
MGRPRGIPLSPEHKAKLLAANLGHHRKHSQETKDLISRKMKESMTLEHRKFISETTKLGMTGKNCSPNLRKVTCVLCNDEFVTKARRHKYCSGCIPDGKWASRWKLYGISKKTWDEMFQKQEGHCLLCEKIPTVIDHDHRTNRVRGLLCQGCNIGVARLDVPDWAEKALSYTQLVRFD